MKYKLQKQLWQHHFFSTIFNATNTKKDIQTFHNDYIDKYTLTTFDFTQLYTSI